MSYDSRIKSKSGFDALEKVRKICENLPEVKDSIDKFGHTSFRFKDKPIVIMGEGNDEASIDIKTDLTAQHVLLQQEYFYKTPYIGRYGWVSLKVDDPIDWKFIENLIKDAYHEILS